MSKKKILLIVRRHAGEIDHILPLLQRLSASYEILTIFSDYQSYDSLLNSKELYSLWKKICSKYFIINNRKNLVYKIIYKFLIFIEKKISLPNYTKIFILKKIFDFEFLLKKFKLETNDINFIFTIVYNLSKLPYLFKYLSKNSRLVRFSGSTWIFPTKDQNKILYKNNRTYNDIHTDIFLLTNNNYNYYLGSKINKNLQKKILYCGFFRYEKFWIRKINKFKTNLKTKKKIIVIATRGPNDLTIKKSSLIYIIESIVKFVKKIKNIKIIFKIHPNKNIEEINIIKKILKMNNFKSYIFSTNHPMNLAINAHACISINTSVCLDFIYVKKSVIEFFNAKTENKNNVGVVFNLKNNKWMSNFEKYKLVNNVKNDKEFDNQLKRHLKNKSKLNNKNYKILKKINSNSFDSLKLSNYLKNM